MLHSSFLRFARRDPDGLLRSDAPSKDHPAWADDEIDRLVAHRQFLEVRGFAVEQAVAGSRLLSKIRAIDHTMPAVLLTQSEDPSTLREAIGVEVGGYLVKPVHPRQILSVVTRLVEGDRIRQQRLARDFVTRFRELEARCGNAPLPGDRPSMQA